MKIKSPIPELHTCFDAIDLQIADLMVDLSGGKEGSFLFLATALLSHFNTCRRYICLDLNHVAGRSLNELLSESRIKPDVTAPDIRTPASGQWLDALTQNPVVGSPGDYKPLVLDHAGRLYFYRYWAYEQNLAESIRLRLQSAKPAPDPNGKTSLNRFFNNKSNEPDLQKMAAYIALTRKFCVISGGPGTGKTHTVASIISLLLETDPAIRISICAPTGKAAARLQESINRAVKMINRSDGDEKSFHFEATTIHRLLGATGKSSRFRHNRKTPLPADVLIVDEASMVSLALMSKLMDALQPKTSLILLGDRNQLSSVEAGSVLGDICDAGEIENYSDLFRNEYLQATGETIPLNQLSNTATSPFSLTDHIVELKHSYRFEEASGIEELSKAVKKGDADSVLDIFNNQNRDWILRQDLPSISRLFNQVEQIVINRIEPVFNSNSLGEAFALFDEFRILCSHRMGYYGVTHLNGIVEKIMMEKGRITPGQINYHGRPVIIKENDYLLGLYNGDTGLIQRDEDGELRAFFRSGGGEIRSIIPTRLPRHESAYALTVHESQGSEFDEVLIILKDVFSPILSQELLYTAITRAKMKVTLWANIAILVQTIKRNVERTSGLRDRLKALGQ